MAGETNQAGASPASNVGDQKNAPAAAISGGASRPSGTQDDPHRDTLAGGTTNPQGGVTTGGEKVANAAGDRPLIPARGDTPATKVEPKKAEKVQGSSGSDKDGPSLEEQRRAADGDTQEDLSQFAEPEGTVHSDQFRTKFPNELQGRDRIK